MVLAMAKDVRVISTLADRFHNMRTMQHMRSDRQKAISQETLDIFVNRQPLGLEGQADSKTSAFSTSTMTSTRSHAEAQRGCRGPRWLHRRLVRSHGGAERQRTKVEIKGRSKHLFSVY